MVVGPYPKGVADYKTVHGDNNIYGRFYVGFQGQTMMRFNYLLNRDLDPANDNSPVGLNKAA